MVNHLGFKCLYSISLCLESFNCFQTLCCLYVLGNGKQVKWTWSQDWVIEDWDRWAGEYGDQGREESQRTSCGQTGSNRRQLERTHPLRCQQHLLQNLNSTSFFMQCRKSMFHHHRIVCKVYANHAVLEWLVLTCVEVCHLHYDREKK